MRPLKKKEEEEEEEPHPRRRRRQHPLHTKHELRDLVASVRSGEFEYQGRPKKSLDWSAYDEAQAYELADIFGINAARQPDGFAQVSLKLSEYRKLEPGPLEELIFFDHPSGRTRIRTAMRWKAEHPETWSAAKTSAAPR